jgi:hypothetical protein
MRTCTVRMSHGGTNCGKMNCGEKTNYFDLAATSLSAVATADCAR